MNEEDYARQTFVELSAGKGPDILCGDLMGEYVRGLMDALSDWEGEADYIGRYGPEMVLSLFLEGSEDLWGMVDWEAEGYFSGSRSMEDVVKVIQNRVQLYLDENR